MPRREPGSAKKSSLPNSIRVQALQQAARQHTGTAALCGGALDDGVLAGLDALVRDQIMAMKTTFTPGHYRRRVAGVLARRLVQRLFAD